jgi:hypothetical protein
VDVNKFKNNNMNFIKNILIVVILFGNSPISAQSEKEEPSFEYSDIILFEGEHYLMKPSPSKGYSSANNIWCRCDVFYRGVYEIKNDSLYFVKVLGIGTDVNKRYRDSITFPAAGTFISTTENYKLLAVRNSENIAKQLKTNLLFYKTYSDQYQEELNVKSGVIQREYFIQDSSETFEEYGKVKISYYSNKMKIDPKVIRVSDSKVMHQFTAEEQRNSYFGDALVSFPGEEPEDIDQDFISYSGDFKTKLPVGKYFVDFSSEGSVFFSDTFEIEIGNIAKINYTPGLAYINNNNYYEVVYNEPSFNGYIYDFMYGNNGLLETGNHQVNMFSIGVQGANELFLGAHKRVSIIGSIGGRYGFGLIHPDSSVIGKKDFTFQNYSYLSMEGSGTARFYPTKYLQIGNPRLFIEAGLSYKLPVFFRYIARFDTQKHSDRWMHQFTDLSAIGRIGLHNGVALKAEYRPFNVIKGSFPELPKLTIGISITIYDKYEYRNYGYNG